MSMFGGGGSEGMGIGTVMQLGGGGMSGMFSSQPIEGMAGFEFPIMGEKSPYGGYNTQLPRFRGKPLGFIDADPSERSFIEKLAAGGPDTGDWNSKVSSMVMSLIGSAIGSTYGGPAGGQVGGRAGTDIGEHVGSLF